MGSEKTSVRVIPVTHARPWLEEKLRNLELKLAGVQDFGEVSHEEGFRERILVLAKHRDEYTSQLQMLYQEFGELFRDYAGYENPPVLEAHPVFEKIKKLPGFLPPKTSTCSEAWIWKEKVTAEYAIGVINWICWKRM